MITFSSGSSILALSGLCTNESTKVMLPILPQYIIIMIIMRPTVFKSLVMPVVTADRTDCRVYLKQYIVHLHIGCGKYSYHRGKSKHQIDDKHHSGLFDYLTAYFPAKHIAAVASSQIRNNIDYHDRHGCGFDLRRLSSPGFLR